MQSSGFIKKSNRKHKVKTDTNPNQMDHGIRVSLRKRSSNMIRGKSIEPSLVEIIDYVSDVHVGSDPIKIDLKRIRSVRYAEFRLEISLNGEEVKYNNENIGDTIKYDNFRSSKFLKNAVHIGGYEKTNQNIMIINTKEKSTYKALMSLCIKDDNPYPTKVYMYTDQDLKIEDEYNLMYTIDLGYDINNIDPAIREILSDRSEEFIYELRDDSKENGESELIEINYI